jgi:hypothetical protein
MYIVLREGNAVYKVNRDGTNFQRIVGTVRRATRAMTAQL